MIVVMKRAATEKEIEGVIDRLLEDGFDVHRSTGAERTVIGVVGTGIRRPEKYRPLPGVKKVVRISD